MTKAVIPSELVDDNFTSTEVKDVVKRISQIDDPDKQMQLIDDPQSWMRVIGNYKNWQKDSKCIHSLQPF